MGVACDRCASFLCLCVLVSVSTPIPVLPLFLPLLFNCFLSCFVALEPTGMSGLGHVFIVTELACGGDLLAMLLSDKEVRAGASEYEYYSSVTSTSIYTTSHC